MYINYIIQSSQYGTQYVTYVEGHR